MLRTHQYAFALTAAAIWGGIVLSMAGPKVGTGPVPAAEAAQTFLTATVPPVSGPVELSSAQIVAIVGTPVPRPEPIAAVAHPVAAPAILSVAAAPNAERYVDLQTFEAVAASVGWQVTDRFVTVATCEAGIDLDLDGVKEAIDVEAISPWGDRGPLQINPVHARPGGLVQRMGYVWDDMLRLVPNLVVGLALYESAGFAPWTCNPP